jgi:hypothetical protein
VALAVKGSEDGMKMEICSGVAGPSFTKTALGVGVGAGVGVGVGAGAGVTVMLTLRCTCWPPPVQVKTNVPELFKDETVSLLEVALLPLHRPEAVHDVALAETQVSVVLPPCVSVVGLALKVSVGAGVGAGVTVMLALRCTLPPGPVQESTKLVESASGPTVSVLDVERLPLQPPLAVQDVASVAVQLSWLVPPAVMLLDEAVRVRSGAFGVCGRGALGLFPPPPPPPQPASAANKRIGARQRMRLMKSPL